MTHTLTFSLHKKTLARFEAEALSFERQDAALLLTAQGRMREQDTPALESLAAQGGQCHVHLQNTLDGLFDVQFMVLEEEMVVVRLG